MNNKNEFYEIIKEKNEVIVTLIELLCIAEFKNRGLSLKENEEMLEDLQDYLWNNSSSWLCAEDESCDFFNENSGCDGNHCEAFIEFFINERINSSEENDELLIYIEDPMTLDEINLEVLASAFNHKVEGITKLSIDLV